MIGPRQTVLGGLAVLGLIGGLFVGRLSRVLAAPEHPAESQVLIALVDDLRSAEPRLLGLWAVTKADTTLQLRPIYPAPLTDRQNLYAQPHAAIRLSPQQLQGPQRLITLSGSDHWETVHWLDLTAFATLNTLAGHAPALYSQTWEQPQRALRDQVAVLNHLCAAASVAITPESLDVLLGLMPKHLRSTLSPFELITTWDDWAQQNAGVHCSHSWTG
ncbi:MAG: hypothetical protein KIS80_06125 [Anaerolineales bacterium]|nr:hypothetical protein [Anaerolineales bacterium]